MKPNKQEPAGLGARQLTRRFSRHALRRPNLAYFLWRFVANGVRTAGLLITPRSYSDTAAVSHALRGQGIVVDASSRFLTADGQRALADASERVLETSRSTRVEDVLAGRALDKGNKKDFLVRLASYPDGVPADEPLLRVALDPKLLEVVSHYFGLWPRLHSVSAWLNYATDSPPELSQLWHRDPEDVKIVKVFIYLTDVDQRCGPFTYIPGTHPFGRQNARAKKIENKKRVTDDKMARVFAPNSWQICTGPPSTMIMADTVGYHRGGKPDSGNRRILITFTYTSGIPMTESALRVRALPDWAASALQRFATPPLLAQASPAMRTKNRQPSPSES